MERGKVVLGLRIAVSAVCGLLCVLLVVLWVHSYFYRLQLVGSAGRFQSVNGDMSDSFTLNTMRGDVALVRFEERIMRLAEPRWNFFTRKIDARMNDRLCPSATGYPILAALGFRTGDGVFRSEIIVPHWFLVFLSATLAAVPWVHWSNRFSLRTLLLATTLIAVLLGLVVWTIG